MKDIVSIIINIVVMAVIVYGFISVGGKMGAFGIIINIIAITVIGFSTHVNIKNIKKRT